MSWYNLALIIHIFGVLILFSASSLQLLATLLLRRAASVPQVSWSGSISRRTEPAFPVAAALIGLSGIYMMIRIGDYGWTLVALVTFIIMSALGTTIGKRNAKMLESALSKANGEMTDSLKQATGNRQALYQEVLSVSVILGLVIIMIVKPSVIVSIIVVLVSAIVGLAAVHLQLGKSAATKAVKA